jgi:hypothetical protein
MKNNKLLSFLVLIILIISYPLWIYFIYPLYEYYFNKDIQHFFVREVYSLPMGDMTSIDCQRYVEKKKEDSRMENWDYLFVDKNKRCLVYSSPDGISEIITDLATNQIIFNRHIYDMIASRNLGSYGFVEVGNDSTIELNSQKDDNVTAYFLLNYLRTHSE